jgi:hypothetical protein
MSSSPKVTLVTAFYPIKSKFPISTYLNWASQFLRLDASILLFTSPELEPVFKQIRHDKNPGAPMQIIQIPFDDLDVWKQYRTEWIREHSKDREAAIHSPELYALWAQKAFFMERAIHANVFKTEYFFWCDIGAFRNPNIPQQILKSFPSTDNLKLAKGILMSSVNRLTDLDVERKADGICGNFEHKDMIVGGLWGGSAEACLRWKSAYEAVLIRYFATGRFAGKDQSVMLSAYLEDPALATIVKCNIPKPFDEWFYLEYLVSDYPTVFEADESYNMASIVAAKRPYVGVNIMGGLGNQMFQIAAGYSTARQNCAGVLLLRNKKSDDGRAMYWNSVLGRWTHTLADSLPSAAVDQWHEAEATEYKPTPTNIGRPLFLNGYLQSAKYFDDAVISNEVRMLMRARAVEVDAIRAKYKNLFEVQDRVVVMHARRTDYLKTPHHIAVHGPLDSKYYRDATEKILETVSSPVFLLVSDDPMYWMTIMSEVPALLKHSFQILMDETDVETMVLLQQFHYFILANSTFSWWACWLAEHRKVIAPARWFGPAGPQKYEDIYCQDWIRV